MAVLFLLGNGFDLSIGLKSGYSDVYPLYTVINDEDDPDIVAFKKDIRDSESLHYATWADFEIGMADYAKKLKDEETFLKCIKDFKIFLRNYLVAEENLFVQRVVQHQKILGNSFDDSLRSFYNKGLCTNDVRDISSAIGSDYSYRIISFNYTSKLLSALIASGSLKPYISSLHLHGNLEEGPILGVDNANQMQNLQFTLSRRAQRAFIKPFLNEQTDRERSKTASRWISEANVVCIFGLSLGDSDYTWRTAIKDWLIKKQTAHLVYFKHGINDFPIYLQAERIDEEERLKEIFLTCLGLSPEEKENVFSRVHIPITKSLFMIGEKISHAEANQREEEQKAAEKNESNMQRTAGSMQR